MTEQDRIFVGPEPNRNPERATRLGTYLDRADAKAPPPVVEGILRRTVGLTMEAEGCYAALGGRCDIVAADGRLVETEVVGFSGERLFLMPIGDMRGIGSDLAAKQLLDNEHTQFNEL